MCVLVLRACARTRTHARTHAHSLTHWHSHTHTHTHSNTHTHIHSHTLTHTLSHTLSLSLSHTHTHTHTHTHILIITTPWPTYIRIHHKGCYRWFHLDTCDRSRSLLRCSFSRQSPQDRDTWSKTGEWGSNQTDQSCVNTSVLLTAD